MSWGNVAIGGGMIVSSLIGNKSQKAAADSASAAQTAASQAGVDEQRRQFDAIQALLAPYVNAGTGALSGQQALLGLNGPEAQRAAIQAIQDSPKFAAITQQGENSILQNASATGGLRGGNVQGALAQFRPQVLSSLIDSQFGQLGGLTTMGQNSAVQQANVGQNSANSISKLLGDIGSAQAGRSLAYGAADANSSNQAFQALAMLAGTKF